MLSWIDKVNDFLHGLDVYYTIDISVLMHVVGGLYRRMWYGFRDINRNLDAHIQRVALACNARWADAGPPELRRNPNGVHDDDEGSEDEDDAGQNGDRDPMKGAESDVGQDGASGDGTGVGGSLGVIARGYGGVWHVSSLNRLQEPNDLVDQLALLVFNKPTLPCAISDEDGLGDNGPSSTAGGKWLFISVLCQKRRRTL